MYTHAYTRIHKRTYVMLQFIQTNVMRRRTRRRFIRPKTQLVVASEKRTQNTEYRIQPEQEDSGRFRISANSSLGDDIRRAKRQNKRTNDEGSKNSASLLNPLRFKPTCLPVATYCRLILGYRRNSGPLDSTTSRL